MTVFDKQIVLGNAIRYFEGDTLAAEVWINKYCLKNPSGDLLESSPDDMHRRLAKEYARIEQKYPNPISEEQIYELLEGFKYIIPGGSQMAGVGNNTALTSLSNCFVIASATDSYGGIMRTDEEQIQIMKRRGGVGHDLSGLRPSGALANNSKLGDNAGSTLYMERFSNSTREVAQDGRRGALMLSQHVSHPDIEKFIDMKMQDGKVTGANISVKISNEFMEKVKTNSDFYHTFPVNYDISSFTNRSGEPYDSLVDHLFIDGIKEDTVLIRKSVARKIWNKIIANAWSSAEPGVLFWDKIIEESPANRYGEDWMETSTNPCFTGETIVAVADGRNGVSIKELAESNEAFIVYSARKNKSLGNRGKGWKTEIKEATAFKTGSRKVIKVVLSDDSSFNCTPEHLLARDDNSYIEAQDSLGVFVSKFFSFSNKNTNKSYRHINSISNGKSRQYRMIWEYYNGEFDGTKYNIDHKDSNSTKDFLDNLRMLNIEQHQNATKRQGLDNPMQKLVGSEYLSLYSKRSNIRANGIKYNLSQSKIQEKLDIFDEKFGNILFELKPKDINVELNEKVFVKEIIELGFQDVYDLNVEDNHNFYIITKTDDNRYLNSSGILVHNCGEIPLCPYDSCRLTAINLFSYVEDPFTPNAWFNKDKFKLHVYIAQRLMDDLIDLEIEKIDNIIEKISLDPEEYSMKFVEKQVWENIKEKAILGRRTGLGITAEGDMLAALGYKYGSETAIDFAESIHKLFATVAYRSSIVMAKERGAFPIFDREKETSPFLDRVSNNLEMSEVNEWVQYGRRNIALLTIAPTGTVSLMTRTTSGIEPLFLPFYKRRVKTEDPAKIKFTDEKGDGWNEYFVIHPKFAQWYDTNWYKTSRILYDLDFHKPIEDFNEIELKVLFEKSPYFGATANDIDWKAAVTMQGRIQKWIDHSISKTINLPVTATIQDVNDLYMLAYESGCKGVTVYRDGSRTGVLVSSKDNDNSKFDYTDAFKRPKEVECDIYHKVALKQNWMVIVGKVDGKVYEIFAIKDVDNKYFPTRIEHGKVIKIKSKVYQLEGFTGSKRYTINNIVDLMSEDERVDTRKYSSMLRHGMSPKYIRKQIAEYASIVSFDKVIDRVLKYYVEDDHQQGHEKCTECGGDMIMEEGCSHCTSCSYSKCSG